MFSCLGITVLVIPTLPLLVNAHLVTTVLEGQVHQFSMLLREDITLLKDHQLPFLVQLENIKRYLIHVFFLFFPVIPFHNVLLFLILISYFLYFSLFSLPNSYPSIPILYFSHVVLFYLIHDLYLYSQIVQQSVLYVQKEATVIELVWSSPLHVQEDIIAPQDA